MPEKDFAIEYGMVSSHPVEAFYDRLSARLREVAHAYAQSLPDPLGVVSSQAGIQADSSRRKSVIEDRYEADNIKGRQTQNAFIFFAFWLLFLGFIWWPRYKENKRVIEAYQEYASQQRGAVAENRGALRDGSRMFMAEHALDAAMASVSAGIGLPAANMATPFAYAALRQIDPDFSTVAAAFTFLYKDTPVTDAAYIAEWMGEITTSGSVTVKRTTTYKDGREEVETQKLIARHTQPAPFVEERRALFFPTNFAPNVTIWTHSPDRYAEFEYPLFAGMWRPAASGENFEQSLMQFFTIAAQEQYVK